MPRAISLPSRDVYANLLRDTRGLRREQGEIRDSWYTSLPWDRKEETLFELEMLLKGFACFGNPRNHPGPVRKTAAVAHDFHDELRIVRDALDESITQVRALLGPKDRAYVFSRYLESVLPEDSERSRLIQEQLTQDTPEESLFLLRNTFSSFLEMADGMLRLGRIPHRLYVALLGTVVREIGRNTYFNPLVTLEFRTEFDRIRNAEVLEILHRVENDAAHRVSALCFLALFRALRYLRLVEEYAEKPETTRRSYVVLSVLRSDLRALARFLTGRAGDRMAAGFERELLATPASLMHERYDLLVSQASDLVSLRRSLESLATTLRVEVRRVFERDLPAPDDAVADDELARQLRLASASLRSASHHAIATLCRELEPTRPPPILDDDLGVRRATSEPLRRDVWMFTQILRAFLAKAHAAPSDPDRWVGSASFQFVREFLVHFRAIGYQLVRLSDYQRLDRFLAALESLRDVDLLDPARLDESVAECTDFYHYLDELFAKISTRSELADSPFDRKAAADTLKIYLGAA